MKVYIQNTVGEEVVRDWLVGKDDMPLRLWTDATGETIQPQRKIQVTDGPDWDQVAVIDRKNEGLTREVGTSHTFATPEECWAFKNSLTRPDSQKPHAMAGDVYYRIELPGGGWVDEVQPNCAITLAAIEPIGGVRLNLRYRIMGGNTHAPEEHGSGSYSWLLDSNGHHVTGTGGHFIHDSDHET